MSNDIRDFLKQENVILNLDVSCKRGVLKALSAFAEKALGLNQEKLLETLLEREQLGTTGIGRGVAVPHARAKVPALTGVLARLSTPIDFDAIDDKPVDLVFLLLAPERADADHLKALSRIARLVSADSVQEAMRRAADVETLHAVAVGEIDAKAA